jgi:hypothetical protein
MIPVYVPKFVGFSGGNLIYFINLADPTFMGHNFMHYPCQLSALELDPDGTNSLFISS